MRVKRRISRSINDKKPKSEYKEPSVIISDEPWQDNYFKKTETNIQTLSTYTNTDEVTHGDNHLEIAGKDFSELIDFRNFIHKNGSIKIEDVTKETVSQKLLNNKFFFDFDMDGEISFSDYNIAWNWVQQGKPTDIEEFAKNLSAIPDARRIPYQAIQNNDANILLDNRVVVYEYGDKDEQINNQQLISGLGLDTNTGVLPVNRVKTLEDTSDFNLDGEVDEEDLEILDCFIRTRPTSVYEYNQNRGNCPKISKLPNLLNAKFSCGGEVEYYYGDIHEPGGHRVKNKDTDFYLKWLVGSVTPNEESLPFILSNNWQKERYTGPSFHEVLRDCNIRDGKTKAVRYKHDDEEPLERLDYRDYLIMKEWIRMGKPNLKGTMSEQDALTYFNANSKPGTPIACKMPFELYWEMGTGVINWEDHYSGIENL